MKSPTRRRFLQTAAAAAFVIPAGNPLAGSAAAPRPPEGGETAAKPMKNIFVHQVYFWLKNPGSETDRDKLVEGLMKLTKIKVIKDWHIGVPAGTSREVIDGSYAISWLNVVKNRAAQDAYQVDQVHLKFVEDYKHLWSKVVVYDSVDFNPPK